MAVKQLIGLILAMLISSHALASNESDALWFVQEAGLGHNFSTMMTSVAVKTQTYQMIASDIGKDRAAALVNEHINRVVLKYQNEWNVNLANSYLEHFSVEELHSILREKSKSPYFKKFRGKQRAVGANMKDRSSELLEKAVTEAMQAVFSESSGSNISKLPSTKASAD